METIPRSQNHLAELLGISKGAASKQAGRGMPTNTLEAARAWRKAHLNPASVKGTRFDAHYTNTTAAQSDSEQPGDTTETHHEARTRLTIAEANLAEIKEQELRGQYLERAKVESTAFEISRTLRDSLMNCARRIAADVAGISSADECEAIIEREHRALLENMSHSLANKLGFAASTA